MQVFDSLRSFIPTAFRWSVVLFVAAGILPATPASSAADSNPPVVTGDARVDKLLSEMTLAEKTSLIHGAPESAATSRAEAGYMPGIPRLGIPALRLTDGPPGISDRDPSTGMPSTVALAATFSKEDARRNGIVVGRDARALGQDIVLEPFINIARDFTFTRGYNTYGEDPLLTGQIAAEFIQGVQAQGVMAQAKHFIAYDGGNDVVVDPQTLREIYIAPFVDAVNAGVSSVMCSYNKINGPYACGSADTQIKILRQEDGFKGFITSDWGGTHGTLFVNNGLDLEMPGAAEAAPDAPMNQGMTMRSFFLANAPTPPDPNAPRPAGPANIPGGFGRAGGPPEELRPDGAPAGPGGGGGGRNAGDPPPIGMLNAIQMGQVSEVTVTAAAGRILFEMDKFGLLDKAPKHDVGPEDDAFNAPIIRKTAEDAAVLLKNDGNILPLTSADLDSVAFIGPNAGQLVSIGAAGEKASGIPAHQVGPVAALEQITGKKFVFAVANDMNGTPIPASTLSYNGTPGLLRTDGATGNTQVDPQLNFTVSNGKPLPTDSALVWDGNLTVPKDGSYMIALQILGASGSILLDGKLVVGAAGSRGAYLHPMDVNVLPTNDNLANARARVTLTAGPHRIVVTVKSETPSQRVDAQPVQVRLAWLTPDQDAANYQAAIDAAKHAKKAIVFAWGRDRPDVFQLPGNQNQLIADIAAVNPNTVVVLNTSLPVAMPWLASVKGVVQMWWPGDEGGPATADILLGRANPSGRLPITWPATLDQMVANDRAHPERSSKGVNGKTTYSEGLMVGYRWFDQQKLAPLFPFGFGLSYSKFAYSNLHVRRKSGAGLEVTATIQNTGATAGDEVVQAYLEAPAAPLAGAQFAPEALAGFERIHLEPHQSQTVTVEIPERQLEYWSTSANKWTLATQTRGIHLGSSSRHFKLSTSLNVQ